VIIKWFNPLIYWFRNALKATHEFIADQYVIQQKSNVGEYATLLVNQHKKQVATPLTNTFYAMTKKRLQMMLQQPSRKVFAIKYILIFPLLMGLMGLFSFNLLEEIPAVNKGLAEMNTVIGDITETTVFEIEQPFKQENDLEKDIAALAQNIFKDADKHILYWGELELALNKQNGQPIPIVDVPINQFLASYQQEPIAALKVGGLFEEVSFSLYSYVIGESNLVPCAIISNTNEPAIFKDNECIKAFKDKLVAGTLVSGDDLQIEKEGQRYKFQLRLIDPKAKRPNPNGKFRFKWGGIEFPIELRKNDFNTNFSFESVQLNDLQAALNQPITVLEDGQIAEGIQEIMLNIGQSIPKGKNTTTYQNFEANLPSKILLDGNGKTISDQIDVVHLMSLLDEQASFSFYINGFDFAGFIQVENGKYHSPIQVTNKEQDLFNFQVIIPDEAKTILKIDTTLAENKSIVKMYRNPNKYEIVHISNFKTTTRSIVGKPTNADPVFDKSHRAIPSPFFKTNKEAVADDKLLYLPEYVDYQPKELTLKWGDLVANPSSDNYDLRTFLENFKTGLQLTHVDKQLRIQKLRVVIAEKDKDYKIFDRHLPNLKDLQQVLGKLSTETSIYFDKLIIEVEGERYYLPQQFLFKIGKQAMAENKISFKEKDINQPLSQYQQSQKEQSNLLQQTPNYTDSSEINSFHLYPFTYSNQVVIRKEKMENPDGSYRIAYTQKMEDYERIEAKRLAGEAAIAEFGEAGRKGISYVIFQHKKKKKRINVDKKNKPLYIYYMHPYFPMITHKLIYDNLEANDIASIEKFPPTTDKARFYGTLGKNGVVEIRFNYPKRMEKEDPEPVKITIKKANPNWSNTTWLDRDSNHTVYLMKNISLSKAFKLFKKLPANQIDVSKLKDDFAIYISIHGHLKAYQDEDWVIAKIKEQFPLEIIEKQARIKVLVLKKGSASSLAGHEYFTASLPNIKSIILDNQEKDLKTITPGYFKDYQQLVRENFELPLIDETGLFGEAAICLGINPTSIETMKEALKNNYGLELVEEERLMPVYELR